MAFLGPRVLPYQVEVKIYLTFDLFLFCLDLVLITSLAASWLDKIVRPEFEYV